ncbi:DUF4097 domain-containing protein [Sphingobacterium sp. lm-10]|uniref:DUF4097 family beta strand repeat-containing protein n=1 Tax=Sphingobacterium sp. lm-10 TaxID=2944904 RepID=UPI002021115A|nr:DUF4097 domain-containing protein [Sphingobacterium sp. lm-10]MCL7988108.1 DUF4097 domain-containing protein [Sphingobacterium sp. lm-10]
MRYLILTTLFFVSLFGLQAQQKNLSYTQKKFSASSIKSLDASTVGGSIRVEGTSGEASVDVILNPNGNKLLSGNGDLKSLFEKEYDLELGMKGGTLVAKVKRKSGRSGNNPLSVSYIIHVPTKVTSQVKTAGGSISMSNLTGDQNFATSGGSLTLTSLNGNINGRTSGGSITAKSSKGTIQISTSGGSITMEQLNGTIVAKTSGGSITGKQVVGKLDASTSGGSIKLENSEGDIQAATSGGSVTASLTKITNPVRLSTSAGSINLSLPKGGYDLDLSGNKVNIDNLQNFSGSTKRDKVKGSVNGGGHSVTATTSAGSVNLNWL